MENQKNPINISDRLICQFLPPIEVHNQIAAEKLVDDTLRMQPPIPHSQEFYRVNVNITDYDGPLFLPPLPHGHTFVVTSSLMYMLTERGLFARIPLEDPHSHIAKLMSVCKSCVGSIDLDMKVIGLRVFPLSLTEDAVI